MIYSLFVFFLLAPLADHKIELHFQRQKDRDGIIRKLKRRPVHMFLSDKFPAPPCVNVYPCNQIRINKWKAPAECGLLRHCPVWARCQDEAAVEK